MTTAEAAESRRSSAARLARASVALVTLSVAFTWPVVAHLGDSIPADPGDPLLNAWALGWGADRLAHGLSGVWDAPIFYPYHRTLAFSEHLLGIAIPVAPIVWATGNPIIAYNVAYILSFALAGLGMFVLAHELTSREDAAWIAALVFAFAPARFGQIGHVQVLMSGWMPLALWGLSRFLRTRSAASLAACGLFVLAQGLSNNYFVYFSALPLSAVAIHGVVRCATRERPRLLLSLAAAGAVVAGVLAPVALVYFGVRRTFGFHRTLQDGSTFGADLGAYLHGNEAVHPPLSVWRHLPFVAKPGGPEGELFPGALALVLAVVAIAVSSYRRRESKFAAARVYAVVLAIAVMLSMGADPTAWGVHLPIGSVFRALFAALPGFDGIRVPARFSVVANLAIAVLAGFGTTMVVSHRVAARVAATTAMAAVILLEGYGAPLPVAFLARAGRSDRAAYDWIRDHAPGPLLELPTGEFGPPLQSYRYEYQTLFHGQPIVNGASGYTSALHAFVGSFGSPLVEESQLDEGLRMLRGVGVRTVTVHARDYSNAAVGIWTASALGASRQVIEQAQFPGVKIFRLAPFAEDERPERRSQRDERVIARQEVVEIGAPAFVATASPAADRIANAFDGNVATRWITGKRQEGDEVVELTFDRAYDVARLRFLISGRSLGDYPRRLIVDGIDEQDRAHTVYDGPVVFQIGLGLVRDPIRGTTDVWLLPNHSRRLRLRQAGTTRRWSWSIDELSVWRPRD